MIKLKDLAERLGLSPTTVSRALNGYPEVNEKTRQRVLEAARQYDYRPNASARRLATGRAGAIGAVLPTNRNLLVDPHFVEFLAGIGERLVEDEIDIVLSPTTGDDEMAKLSAHGLRHSRRCDHPVEPDDRGCARPPASRPWISVRYPWPHQQPAAPCLARHRQRRRLSPRHQPPPRSRPSADRPDQRRHALHLRGASRARLSRRACGARHRGRSEADGERHR